MPAARLAQVLVERLNLQSSSRPLHQAANTKEFTILGE
jgi:hypothetical protein